MQQRFLLQILLLAQHVSGTTVPIIRSSRVLYSGCCLWYFVMWFSVAGQVWSWGLCVRFAGCCRIVQTGHITLSSFFFFLLLFFFSSPPHYFFFSSSFSSSFSPSSSFLLLLLLFLPCASNCLTQSVSCTILHFLKCSHAKRCNSSWALWYNVGRRRRQRRLWW